MNAAYVDTSVLVGIAFDETTAKRLPARLRRFDRLLASNLLEAEFRSALRREGIEESGKQFLDWITWIHPNRPLSREIDRIAAAGHLRGADLWHLANALFLAPTTEEFSFLTLDERQREVAARLGFLT